MLSSGSDTELGHHMTRDLESNRLGKLLLVAMQVYPQVARERNGVTVSPKCLSFLCVPMFKP